MRPALRHGDWVRLHHGVRAKVGDVIVVRTSRGEESGLLAHRLFARHGDVLLTRGDARAQADEPHDEVEVLGVVTAVEGRRGYRLDGYWRYVGRMVALHARWLHVSAGRVSRPRPARSFMVGRCLAKTLLGTPRPEDSFVLLCARGEPGDAALASAVALAHGGLDWTRVAESCLLGQVGPLVQRTIDLLGDRISPEPTAAASLERQAIGAWMRSHRSSAIAAQMLARFADAGIEAMAHKGLALAHTVYADPGLRIAGDIDLSVRDEQRSRAETLVRDIRDALYAENPTRRDSSGHHVELDGSAHHDLDPSLHGDGRWQATALDWDAMWRRAKPCTVAGQIALVPCPSDLLLTLVANALRRGCSPVRLVADVAETIRVHGTELDWDAFAAQLRSCHLHRRSWFVLGLAVDWFDADVPPALLEPPGGLRMTAYERWLLARKRAQPFMRLPTGVLWAGSLGGALRAAAHTMTRHLPRAT